MTKINNDHGIVFKTVKLKNFLSFSNVETIVELDGSGTTLIIGENLDNGGSSGAGKSTLINAISYCLYDKIPSGVSKDKLINRTNDKKNTTMEVELTLTKGIDIYKVRRWRGGATGVQLLMNDKDITPASVNRGEDSLNSKIEDILGFSYNLFSQIILFNGSSVAFLDLSVSSQRALIEELFRITMLSRKAVALKKDIVELEKSISMQKLLIDQQRKQNVIYQKHLFEASDRIQKWDTARIIELEATQKRLDISVNIDFDTEESLLNEVTILQANILTIQSDIKELTLSEQSEQRELQAKKQAELKELQLSKATMLRETSPKKSQLTISSLELTKLKKDLIKVEQELIHLRDTKCPYCLQKIADAEIKIKDEEAKSLTLSTEISLLSEKISQLEADVEEFDRSILENVQDIDEQIKSFTVDLPSSDISIIRKQDIIDKNIIFNDQQMQLTEIKNILTFKDLSSLLKTKGEISIIKTKIETLSKEINPHVEAYNALIAEGEVKVDIEALDELILFQEHQQFLLKLLTDKNSFIRKNIISKTIPFLNKRIAYYTEKLNLPHIVLFQPDMTCEITEFSRDLDHGNLSNGEKKKLNLSLCLSFRDVLTYLHSKVNVLFTDEIDGGAISGIDLEKLISLLKLKAWDDDISIFIISHRHEFEGRCDHNLVIRKERGFSSIIVQPD